jgi:hypothetical protein
MSDDEQDETTFGKILEAAQEIEDMARVRPAEAPAMLEQARHLVELAEQMRRDWLRRRGVELSLGLANSGASRGTAAD